MKPKFWIMDGDSDASAGSEAILHVIRLLKINDETEAEVGAGKERGEAEILLLSSLQRIESEAVPVLRTCGGFPDPESRIKGLFITKSLPTLQDKFSP